MFETKRENLTMSILENLTQYRTTSSSFYELEKPILLSILPSEESMVKGHSSYSKKTFFNLTKHRDSVLTRVKGQCLNECIESFPEYSCFVTLKRVTFLSGTVHPTTKANKFRVTASRNDSTHQIFLGIELAFDRDIAKRQKQERLEAEEEMSLEEALREYPGDDENPKEVSKPLRKKQTD